MAEDIDKCPLQESPGERFENENNPKCHKPETEKSHQGDCTAKILVFCAPVPSKNYGERKSGFITLPGNGELEG